MATASSRLLRGRSVIFLFQQGGPSQFETFDPKPDAPAGVRTITGVVPTSLPGVHFGEHLPRLAARANQLAIVRSFQTGNANHNIEPIVGPDSLKANIGTLYARVAGATRPDNGMPANVVLFPQSVASNVTKSNARGDILATGSLGNHLAPFVPGAGGPFHKNLTLNVPPERLAERRVLLEQFDRMRRQLDAAQQRDTIDEAQAQAFQVLLGGQVAEAFDLTREPATVRAMYDTEPFVRADGWSSAARGKRGFYTGHARGIGKQLLLARRLCEAGCGYVTIHTGYDGVWDMHADRENLNMADGMQAVAPAFDHAVAAFLDDVRARGLQDRILLVCCGEMGRTPRINKNGGRDHWARLAPLLLAGGGLEPGQVIGSSRRDGSEPATDPLTPRHLISTILHTLFDVGELRVTPGLEVIARLGEHPPLPVA